MSLIRIKTYPGLQVQTVIAAEEIAHLAVVEINPVGSKYVGLGSDNQTQRLAGVAWGSQSGAVSGKLMHIVNNGLVSGVVCASSVQMGETVTCVSGGRIQAMPNYKGNFVSGGGAGYGAVVIGGATTTRLAATSGLASGIDMGIPAGRILGKAFASGTLNQGIPVLVGVGP